MCIETEFEGAPDQALVHPWQVFLADDEQVFELLFVLWICHSRAFYYFNTHRRERVRCKATEKSLTFKKYRWLWEECQETGAGLPQKLRADVEGHRTSNLQHQTPIRFFIAPLSVT